MPRMIVDVEDVRADDVGDGDVVVALKGGDAADGQLGHGRAGGHHRQPDDRGREPEIVASPTAPRRSVSPPATNSRMPSRMNAQGSSTDGHLIRRSRKRHAAAPILGRRPVEFKGRSGRRVPMRWLLRYSDSRGPSTSSIRAPMSRVPFPIASMIESCRVSTSY